MYLDDVEVAVIGGGPAGLGAALSAKKNGAKKVVVLEREVKLGGVLHQCIHNGFGLHYFGEDLTGPEYAFRFIEEAEKLGIEILLDTMVLKLAGDHSITAINKQHGLVKLKPKVIVLAMGCRERPRGVLRIPGSRPSGIYTAGTAQRLVNLEGHMPGKDIVILGSGDIGMIMARRLTLEGANVKLVAEILPFTSGLIRNEVQCLRDFNIPLFLSHTVTFIHGKERVRGVTLTEVTETLEPIKGTEQFYECDTLLLSVGLIPENELSLMAGIKLSAHTNAPVVDQRYETSVPGIFCCGNVLQVHDLVDNVTNEAETVGQYAAELKDGRNGKERRVVEIQPGNNVRYVVPQNINLNYPEEDVTISIRVKAPVKKGTVTMGSYEKRYKNMKPSEMIRFKVNKKVFEDMGNLNEVMLNCNASD